jgi:hypothetical protein
MQRTTGRCRIIAATLITEDDGTLFYDLDFNFLEATLFTIVVLSACIKSRKTTVRTTLHITSFSIGKFGL